MSLIYETLVRADLKRRKSAKASEVSISGQDGNSCLAAIESLYSTSGQSSRSKPEDHRLPLCRPLKIFQDILRNCHAKSLRLTLLNLLNGLRY